MTTPSQTAPLISGAIAGTLVDTLLFPLDTLKTRLQSAQGFSGSGGFRGIYRGLGPVVLGSAPGGGVFFLVYEKGKRVVEKSVNGNNGEKSANKKVMIWGSVLASSVGEIAACSIRVPVEVVKQRAQAMSGVGSTALGKSPSVQVLRAIFNPSSSSTPRSTMITGAGAGNHNQNKPTTRPDPTKTPTTLKSIRELYRGFGITILRELPFTALQFPLWEYLKTLRLHYKSKNSKAKPEKISTLDSALCGSISGATAAGLTTPLDVIKTRIMLEKEKKSVFEISRAIWKEKNGGLMGFWKGFVPRVLWIATGGAVFLGGYTGVLNFLFGEGGDGGDDKDGLQ